MYSQTDEKFDENFVYFLLTFLQAAIKKISGGNFF